MHNALEAFCLAIFGYVGSLLTKEFVIENQLVQICTTYNAYA